MLRYCSILNDVIGPIMTGPSSSHTAGCARIGRMARILYGKPVKKVVIVFEETGSYPKTYIGQGSSYGFVGGLLGLLPEDTRLKEALSIAKEQGMEVAFEKADLGAHHPNEARIDIYNGQGEKEFSVLTFSTGGGAFEIVEMDGFEVSIKGDRRQAFLCCMESDSENIEALLHGNVKKQVMDGKAFFDFFIEDDTEKILQDSCLANVLFVRIADVVLPVERRVGQTLPFATADEALTYSVEKNLSLCDLALEYECAVGLITREAVMKKIKEIMKVMRASAVPQKQFVKTGFLDASAQPMANLAKTRPLAPVGVLNKSMLWAVAVMENNASHNIVAAAPTAGSCGVIPGAVVAVGEEMGLTDEEIEKGILVSGLIGVFIANQATFGAEVAGCQAENGAAASMAAAGVVQLLNGSVVEGFLAASLALQNLLGLICDPVAGLTEIPCIGRNVASAANAVLSANMVLCGFNPVIPLDETIKSMLEIGHMLPRELRCTCDGGLCVTPTGRHIAEEMAKN